MQGLQRLLEQARSPGELLRWLSQNPTKVRAHHYPVALRRLGQLLVSQPRPPPVEKATLQDLSQLIIRNCPSFDVHTIHVCLHLAVLLGEEGVGRCGCLGKSGGRKQWRTRAIDNSDSHLAMALTQARSLIPLLYPWWMSKSNTIILPLPDTGLLQIQCSRKPQQFVILGTR